MCGICGIIDLNQQISQEEKSRTVFAMNQAMFHRGPDEDGYLNDGSVSLAMRRLSIIDLAGGQQPIYNENKDVCVFFNGEIYNYPELKTNLLQQGHRFRTHTDTEVLVHLYEEHAEDFLPLLKGMFTFCIYDIKKRSILIARDRFGEKPLYYHQQNGVLSFSSEIKSLLENPRIDRVLNTDALPYYLRTSLVPDPICLFKEIYSLPPAHYLKIDQSGYHIDQYFEIDYRTHSGLKTEADAIRFIRPKLEAAVKRQMISDVPIGAFLSGGIDSSTIVALLQQQSDRQIQTFNVRFEDEAYDESPIAREVAAFCQTDHHEITIPNYTFEEDIFWTIIDHVGLPFRDSSAIPTYSITKEIRKHVKVALSGDGGDELFGGYSLFQWYLKILRLQSIPSAVRGLGKMGMGILQKIPALEHISRIRQIDRAFKTSFETEQGIPIALNELFKQQEVERLLGTTNKAINLPLLKHKPQNFEQWSDLRKIMHYRTFHTLPNNMLIKVDRMSMANALEVRAPFLDPDLFDAAAQLPDEYLIKAGKGKYLIRKMMEKDLPAAVFNHPKKGFSIPLFKYQNEVFQQLAERLLFEENPWPNLFKESFLQQIYHQGLYHKRNTAQLSVFQSAHRLWMIMQLLGWAERFNVKYA